MSETKIVTRHGGYAITQDERGYSWKRGGYFDTLVECRYDIDDWNGYPGNVPCDTPSLGAPWWRTEY